MLKAAGILMILTAGAGLGFKESYELTLRERSLGQILLMLRWLKGEIVSRHSSLPDAFGNVAQRMQGCYGEFLEKTAQGMRKAKGMRLGEIYESCAKEMQKSLPLSEKEWELFLGMGNTLGYLDLEVQKKQLEFYEEEFGNLLQDLRAEMPAKKKIYQSLGMMGGILLAILVW